MRALSVQQSLLPHSSSAVGCPRAREHGDLARALHTLVAVRNFSSTLACLLFTYKKVRGNGMNSKASAGGVDRRLDAAADPGRVAAPETSTTDTGRPATGSVRPNPLCVGSNKPLAVSRRGLSSLAPLQRVLAAQRALP